MENERVFNFNKSDIENFIRYDLALYGRIGESFNYIYNKLKSLDYHIAANSKLSFPDQEDYNKNGLFKEDKNYEWTSVDVGDIQLIIRKYSSHLTIYVRYVHNLTDGEGNILSSQKRYSVFEFFVNTNMDYEKQLKQADNDTERELLKKYEEDFHWSRPFYDFNELINPIIELFRENKGHLLWNNSALPRKDRVEITTCFHDHNPQSIDRTIYAAEEISRFHISLFAENDMLEKIKTLKVGDKLSIYEIESISTEVENDYYHDAGITFKDKAHTKHYDVYALTRYYIEDIFGETE